MAVGEGKIGIPGRRPSSVNNFGSIRLPGLVSRPQESDPVWLCDIMLRSDGNVAGGGELAEDVEAVD